MSVSGVGGVPEGEAAAVLLNVTLSDRTGSGEVVLYDGETPIPTASNIGWKQEDGTADKTVTALVGLSPSETITIASSGSGSTHVSLSAIGWVSILDDLDVADSDDDEGSAELDPAEEEELVETGSPEDGTWSPGDESAIGTPMPEDIPDGDSSLPEADVPEGLAAASSSGRGRLTNSFGDYDAVIWRACGLRTSKDRAVRAFKRTPYRGGGRCQAV